MILAVSPAPVLPSPSSPVEVHKVDFLQIVGSVAHGIWAGVTASTWSALAAVFVVLVISVQALHAVAYPRWIRDPVRRFPRQDKAEIVRRAGGRCEHHFWLGGRCMETENLRRYARGWIDLERPGPLRRDTQRRALVADDRFPDRSWVAANPPTCRVGGATYW